MPKSKKVSATPDANVVEAETAKSNVETLKKVASPVAADKPAPVAAKKPAPVAAEKTPPATVSSNLVPTVVDQIESAKEPVSYHPATFGLTNAEIDAIIVDAGSPIDTSKPYNPIFAERVPLMELFGSAVSNAVVQNALKTGSSTSKKNEINILECGVYRGRGSRAMLEIADRMNVPVHLTMLDTFEGLPDLSETDLKLAPKNVKYVRRKVFADTTVREVEAYIGPDFSSTTEFHKGLFSETLPNLDTKRRYAFVFIDCDLYEGHIETLSYVYDKMIPGGIIMFDDYYSKEYPMAMAAVDDFLADKPEIIFRMRFGTFRASRQKAYIVK